MLASKLVPVRASEQISLSGRLNVRLVDGQPDDLGQTSLRSVSSPDWSVIGDISLVLTQISDGKCGLDITFRS